MHGGRCGPKIDSIVIKSGLFVCQPRDLCSTETVSKCFPLFCVSTGSILVTDSFKNEIPLVKENDFCGAWSVDCFLSYMGLFEGKTYEKHACWDMVRPWKDNAPCHTTTRTKEIYFALHVKSQIIFYYKYYFFK